MTHNVLMSQTSTLTPPLRASIINFTSSLILSTFQEDIQAHKDRITELIRENTNRLDQLNMLIGERRNYEKQLDSRQKNLVSGKLCGDHNIKQWILSIFDKLCNIISPLCLFFGHFAIGLYHELAILEWDRGWGNRIEYWQPSYVPLKQ